MHGMIDTRGPRPARAANFMRKQSIRTRWQRIRKAATVTPGHELRTARERLSLSREQISSRTKIQVRKITALEDDALDQLPTGIYLDGIAAAYAREVGLDAETFIRRLRTHVAPPPPETLERIAAARQSAKHRPRDVGLSVAHSMGAFAAVAIVLAIATIGVRLYPGPFAIEPQEVTLTGTLAEREPAARPEIDSQFRWERGTTGSEPVTEAAGSPSVAEPAPPAGPSRPEVVADLELTHPVPLEVPTPVETHPITRAHVERRTAVTDGVERHAVIEEREAPPVIADQKAIQSLAVASPPTQSTPVPPRSSLTGVWTLETEVESSSLRAFKGLRLGFRLELRQHGDRIEGTGQKVTENGIALSGARRTAITVHGTLGEGRMRLAFGEQGGLRRTTGTLDLVIDKNGVLRGVFASEAGRSAGAVEGRRL